MPTTTGLGGTKRDASSHAWERVSAGTAWESVQEDSEGNIVTEEGEGPSDTASAVLQRRRLLAKMDYAQSSRKCTRDMIRYLYLVLDCSRWMRTEKDPALPGGTRLEITLKLVADFITEYYDQNPLSQLGLAICQDGESALVSKLSGSPKTHRLALVQILNNTGTSSSSSKATGPANVGGEFSLQNGLEVAGRSLGHMPKHGSREIVVVLGALSTCDPSDIVTETIPKLQASNIRVSCISLTAEMHICRKLADETSGIMGVALDKNHLRDLITGQTVPPPSLAQDGLSSTSMAAQECEFVAMGFPTRESSDVPSLIHGGGRGGGNGGSAAVILGRTGYLCPRCKAKCTDLPIDCSVCGLKLVLAPHLARSFHHLFPVAPFVEVPLEVELVGDGEDSKKQRLLAPVTSSSKTAGSGEQSANTDSPSKRKKYSKSMEIDNSLLLSSSVDCDRCCFGCLKIVGVSKRDEVLKAIRQAVPTTSSSSANITPAVIRKIQDHPDKLRFQCPHCREIFCADCDAYLHEALHNCPGCLIKGDTSSSGGGATTGGS